MVHDLLARGHHVIVQSNVGSVGKGQIIRRLPTGADVAGSAPRAAGKCYYAAGA